MKDNGDNANKDLDSLLHQQGRKTKSRRKREPASEHFSEPSLDELLDDVDASQKGKTINVSHARINDAAAPLESILPAYNSNPSPRKAVSHKPTEVSAEDLDQYLDKTQVSTSNPKDETNHFNTAKTKLGWLITAGLVVAIVLFMVPKQNQQPVHIEQLNSQDILDALVSDVEKYLQQNRALPVTLEGLPSFPESAISWPISHWNLKNIQGKIEIFWLPQLDMSYAVIVRDSFGAWLYDFSGQVRFVSEDDSASSGSR